MSFEKERELLEQYIREFDPAEFSSGDSPAALADDEAATLEGQLMRFRARLQRKRKLARNFKETLERLEETECTEVIITQEQIDALLAKSGL